MKKISNRMFILAGVFALRAFFCADLYCGSLKIVFIEPDTTKTDTTHQWFRAINDTARINLCQKWLDNPSAQMALDLYERTWNIAHGEQTASKAQPLYYIALVRGGNNGDLGFQLTTASGVEDHAVTPFIKLDPSDWSFSTTFLHETGHVMLSMLTGGKKIPKKEIAAIEHTTAALTDRGTAFDEGFAEHLETLAAHVLSDPVITSRYLHEQFRFGVPDMQGEYNRAIGDLLSFSQTRTRYYDVRENNFSFVPAYKGPDYYRVQMEKSRDFSLLRNPNQLLQAEGFYATFFFCLTVRGNSTPAFSLVKERQQKILEALKEMFETKTMTADSPYLLDFTETYMKKNPSEAAEITDVLLDLSHGVFVDRNAAALWKNHYLGALKLDMAERNNEKIAKARDAWHASVMNDPKILYSLLGPQIRYEVPARSVLLVAFEQPSPLSFDLNTVDEGIMRMIPDITDSEVKSWLDRREQKAFTGADDFKSRSGLHDAVLKSMKF
ncbi:MAG: hypothetical protein ACHQQQ_12680 [Bacteroidota bacterium]